MPFEPVAWESPDIGLLALPNATVAGNQGYVFDQAGTYLIDTNMWYPNFAATPAFGRLKRLSSSVLTGVTLSLLSLWAEHNYFHFLIESVPRIAVFLAAGGAWDDIDHVLFPACASKSARGLRHAIIGL